MTYFDQIKGKFQEGHYKEMILGELERNYAQIKNMHFKLQREERNERDAKYLQKQYQTQSPLMTSGP